MQGYLASFDRLNYNNAYPEKGGFGRKFTMLRSNKTHHILSIINRFIQESSINNKYKQTARNVRRQLVAGGSRKNAVNALRQLASTIRANNRRNFDQGRLSRNIQNRKKEINSALAKGNITQNQAVNFKAKLNRITLETLYTNKNRIYEEVTRAVKIANFKRQINQADIAPNKKNKLRSLVNSNASSARIISEINRQKRLVRNFKAEIAGLNSHILKLQTSNAPNKENKISQLRQLKNALSTQLYKTNIFTDEYRKSQNERQKLGTKFYSWANRT
jgi:hypothetical protein